MGDEKNGTLCTRLSIQIKYPNNRKRPCPLCLDSGASYKATQKWVGKRYMGDKKDQRVYKMESLYSINTKFDSDTHMTIKKTHIRVSFLFVFS